MVANHTEIGVFGKQSATYEMASKGEHRDCLTWCQLCSRKHNSPCVFCNSKGSH